jgi:hypothetical protein
LEPDTTERRRPVAVQGGERRPGGVVLGRKHGGLLKLQEVVVISVTDEIIQENLLAVGNGGIFSATDRICTYVYVCNTCAIRMCLVVATE